MTFKHVKFEDSPIMRSLEKVAQEKGLIKAQPLTKTAAVKKANLTPTTNLTDNVLKLCAGLREQGFEKQAKDLEYNLIAFKQAQTLYEAFPEKGEDLVERAHPEGSHKLENVDSDEAVFEDILDQMAKSLKVVEKKPTGKLSSEAAIKAVKITLGARPLVLKKDKDLTSLGQTAANTAVNIGEGVGGAAAFAGGVAGLKWLFQKLLASKALDTKTIEMIQQQLGRKLTTAEANGIIKQVVDRTGVDAMKKVFGDQAAKSIASEVGADLGTAATEVGGEAAATGAGEAAAGTGISGVLLAPVGLLAGLTSVALSAVAGGILGYAIFQNKFYATQLGTAGNNLSSEVASMTDDANIRGKGRDFQFYLEKVLANIDNAMKLATEPSPEGIKALGDYANNLQDASQAAYKLMSYARGKYSGITGMLFSGYRNVEISASNFINVAQKAISDVRFTLNKATEIAQQQKQQQTSSVGGNSASSLITNYQSVLNQISSYQVQIKANRPKNQQQALTWLDALATDVTKEQGEFTGFQPDLRDKAVAGYSKRLNDTSQKLNAFKNYMKLS